jgi:HPt (histidine-containing phosphotransfer) domain-containing protein
MFSMEESLKRRQCSESSYQRDAYSWALEQARVLRERAAELDWDNLAEEVEDLARRDAHALQSNCEVLSAHLLKLKYASEPQRRRNLRL